MLVCMTALPLAFDRILRIDPVAGTVRPVGNRFTADHTMKYASCPGMVSPDGTIFAVPWGLPNQMMTMWPSGAERQSKILATLAQPNNHAEFRHGLQNPRFCTQLMAAMHWVSEEGGVGDKTRDEFKLSTIH